MGQITDAVLARNLLNSALSFGKTDPDLTEADMLLLIDRAKVTQPDTSIVYTTASLNGAAAQGWQWKAQLASAEFDDLGRIKRPIGLAERWRSYSAAYADGRLDVLAGVAPNARRSGGSMTLVTELGEL